MWLGGIVYHSLLLGSLQTEEGREIETRSNPELSFRGESVFTESRLVSRKGRRT